MKNILHLSDLHVSEVPAIGMSELDLKGLLSPLINDLSTLPKVDTIFITGDISNSGKSAEYDLFSNIFLSPLLAELKIDASRVFVTPGNHDSNRKDWRVSDEMVRVGLIANPQQSSVEGFMKEKISDPNYTWSPNYTSFRTSLDLNKCGCILSNKYFSAYEVDGIGIGCINSAWLSHEKDKNALFVGEWQIQEIIKALKPFKQRVVLLHHPLDWMHPEDGSMLMNQLHASNISCIFYGHMHEFWMTKESIFSEDSVLKLQAGRLDKSKNADLCGYSLVSLHEKDTFESGEIYFRKFEAKENKFGPWTERIKDGKATYSLIDTLPFNPKQFSDCCAQLIAEIEFDLLCNTGIQKEQQKKLSEIFVLPSLSIENENDISEDSFDSKRMSNSPSKYHSINSLSDSLESLVILGGENSGKSTLAKRLTLHYLSNQSAQNLEKIVFYLDLRGKSLNKSKYVQSELLSFYKKEGADTTYHAKLEKKLSSPSAVIIFDSIEHADSTSLRIIFEYIATSPARFLIIGQLSARTVLREMNAKFSQNKNFRYVFVKSLKRNHLKELVSKWNPCSSNTHTSRVASNALKIVSNTGMANNAFVYTMLLSIHERNTKSNKTYMHEADLIENFIEIIMQKHVIPTGNVPLYKDVLLYLGFIAKYMHDNSCYLITENALLQKALDFNKLIVQDFKASSYLEPIIRSGIMRREGDQYKFSQLCFYNYVFANWIASQPTDYSSLDKHLNFIRFDKVVEYVSAIKSDPMLLDYLAEKTRSAWKDLMSTENISDLENADNEIEKCASHDIIDMIKQEALESSFNGSRQTEQEHDETLDTDTPLSDQALVDVKDEVNDVNYIVRFHEALSLYARAFRSAEHILDPVAKNRHFSYVFQSYMNSIAFGVRSFDQKGRPLIINQIKTILDYEKIEEGKRGEIEAQVHAFINFMIAAIPNWGVAMMSSDFFNHRQRQHIKIHRGQAANNLEKILLTYCLCELDDVNITDELKSQKFEKRHESSSLILKLLELIYFNFSITEAEKVKLNKMADKVIKDRKNLQLIKNYSAVSKKMAQGIEIVDLKT